MIKIYQTVAEKLVELQELEGKNLWVCLIAPTEEEIVEVSRKTGIDPEYLHHPLDDEERPRIELNADQILVIIKIPVEKKRHNYIFHDTIPLGIIITREHVVTVCLEDTPLFSELVNSPDPIYTFKRTRFLLQVLVRTAALYLRYLRQIDKRSTELQHYLSHAMRNEELLQLLEVQKSLVYFTTSLKANGIVMEKLLRTHLAKATDDSAGRLIKMRPEDEDLLEDVITENKQAIEMSTTYSAILTETMDAFASLISNNLNMVMKFLTSVTIVLSVPMIITSFYGMNVHLPFQGWAHAYLWILATIAGFSGLVTYILARKRMF
uniref:Magnesium transporter CorA family protein n=1 Tax=Ammonifex degensii TaxID=42838 RepID=A0A7C1JLC8_9THEO